MRIASVALAVALALGSVATAHAGRTSHSFTTSIDDDKPIFTCADIDMQFWNDRKGDLVTVRREQSISVTLPRASALRLRAPDRGGIRVQAAAGSTPSAATCMAAGGRNAAAAEQLLEQVHIVNSGGELTVTGPEDADWAAYILLSVPKDVALDLEAANGSLSLHGVTGKFMLRTTNGPISIRDVSGEVDGEAQNGPIHFHGHEGDVRLAAQNGPIGVKLDAATWTGKGLSASTENGPVSLTAPPDLRTGVQVKGSEHSPFHSHGLRSLGDGGSGDHTVRFGEGPVLVRLSTVNGPVQIKGGAEPRRTTKSSAKDIRI